MFGKEIEGFENYHIFEDGRVWSCKRGIFLKGSIARGYIQVNLNGKWKKIHRLVGQAFIPNPENKPEIDHIDRNRTNNHFSNLRWATHQENMNNIGEPSKYKNNKSGFKNISYWKYRDKWVFKKTINGVKIWKYFKTLEEAIAFKLKF